MMGRQHDDGEGSLQESNSSLQAELALLQPLQGWLILCEALKAQDIGRQTGQVQGHLGGPAHP